jgi:hypothetical protein
MINGPATYSLDKEYLKPSSSYEYVTEDKETTLIGSQVFYQSSIDCQLAFSSLSFFDRLVGTLNSYRSFFSYCIDDYRADNSLIAHKIIPLTNLNKNDQIKNKLVVLIPGLNSTPYTFKKLIIESEKKDLNDLSIYIPKVLNQGNASLDEAMMPIFQDIKRWAQFGQDKELVLVGESNGARIACAIDAEISKPENRGNIKTLKVVSIAGACQGSKMANIANALHLSCLMNINIRGEMATDSYRSKKLYSDWHEGLIASPDLDRQYSFIAASDDWLVPNFDSSLFPVPLGMGRYTIMLGHGHLSIVDASASIVSDIIFP